jgi:flagellar biosynthesis GTPase FlhF
MSKVSELRARYDEKTRSHSVFIRSGSAPSKTVVTPLQLGNLTPSGASPPDDSNMQPRIISVQDRIKHLIYNAHTPRDMRIELPLPTYTVTPSSPQIAITTDKSHETETLKKQLEEKNFQLESMKREMKEHQDVAQDNISSLEHRLEVISQELERERKEMAQMKQAIADRDQLQIMVNRLREEADQREVELMRYKEASQMELCLSEEQNHKQREVAAMAERLKVLLESFEEGSRELVDVLEDVVGMDR